MPEAGDWLVLFEIEAGGPGDLSSGVGINGVPAPVNGSTRESSTGQNTSLVLLVTLTAVTAGTTVQGLGSLTGGPSAVANNRSLSAWRVNLS